MNRKKKLGILLSGRGSNMVAIAERIADGRLASAEVAVVISNVAGAAGLVAAEQRELKALTIASRGRDRREHDLVVKDALQAEGVDLVVLAGYMRLLSPDFVRAFPQRIVNIHPSLLPAFAGLDAQQQAWEYGVKLAGCTVHFVDEELDHGVIILQREVAVDDSDTADSLAAKILCEEHEAYSEAIARVLSGQWSVQGRRYLRHAESHGPTQPSQ